MSINEIIICDQLPSGSSFFVSNIWLIVMFCKALMSETMSFDLLRSSMWTDLQGPVNINMQHNYSSIDKEKKLKVTSCASLTSMEADIGGPSFHSWQPGDEVDKHPASHALLS